MRVVAVVPGYPPHDRVGAFLATHDCLAALAAAGHKVDVLTRVRNYPAYELDDVNVDSGLSRQAVDGRVTWSDVVISHAGDDGAAHSAAITFGKPSVRMVHGGHDDLEGRLEGAALVVFNSRASACASTYAGKQIVVRPTLRDVKVPPGDRVTLVNLSDAKGGELFWRLAEVMPRTPFLAVRGGWGRQISNIRPNVEVLDPVSDIREVFARTRLLLMPSKRETWGMVGVEALSCGIPVIAAPTPGLKESLGIAGCFVDLDDRQGWVDAIDTLYRSPEWDHWSTAATVRASQIPDDRPLFVQAVESAAA